MKNNKPKSSKSRGAPLAGIAAKAALTLPSARMSARSWLALLLLPFTTVRSGPNHRAAPVRGTRLPRRVREVLFAIGLVSVACITGCGSESTTPKTTAECSSYRFSSSSPGAILTGPIGDVIPLAVKLSCEDFSNPIRDASITWAVLTGGGTVNNASSTTTTTSVGGTAGVNWQLGPVVGVQQVRASFAGNDVTFTATAVALGPCVATPTSTDHGVFTTVSADQTWTAAGSPHLGQTVVIENATITVEAGAVVCVQVIESADPQTGRIVAEGTAVAPIRFIGTDLVAVKSLKHVRGENLKRVGRAITGHFVSALEDSNFTFSGAKLPLWCYQVAVGGNATVLRTVIAGYGAPDCAALYLGALGSETVSAQVRVFSSSGDGVRLAGNGRISLSGCELFNNAGHGIYAPLPGSTTASVNGCNITANTGDAIRTELPTPIDATGNWWGDARGPVASGVRLTGAINVGAWLTAPATVGY